ncbi:MAG: EamA family transporter [Oscillospiraceae bacterium]|nr:EamA family transporter [Oscillospiraceae bacterium]
MKPAMLKYLASLIFFGANGIVASFIALSSYEIVLLRTLLGGTFLTALFFLRGGKLHVREHPSDTVYVILSGISMAACWLFLYEAYSRIGVSIASLCHYAAPVIVMVVSPLLFREKLTAPRCIGFLIAIGGVLLINGFAASDGNRSGVLLALLSAVAYAGMIIAGKKNRRITGLENSMLQLLTAFATVGIFVLCRQGLSISIPRESILPLLFLGVLNTGGGCYLYFSSIGSLRVQTVAVLSYLEPLSAVLLSALVLHEPMTAAKFLGTALILGGACIGEFVRPKQSV